MKQKVLTLVLAAMVSTCAAMPHHPVFIAGFPPRHVSYLPYYGNMARVSLVSVPQLVSPGQLILLPPGPAGVRYEPQQTLVENKQVALGRDQVNFCKIVGNSLASSPPSSLEIEEPLTVQPITVGDAGSPSGSTLKSPWSPDGPRRRQSVGPINLNYMCKRIARLPIPGQFGIPSLVRYCKRLAHTIAANSPFLLRQLPTSHSVPEINFTGLYESQNPLRSSSTEANKITTLCQTMLLEVITNQDRLDDSLDSDDELKPPPPLEESTTAETTETLQEGAVDTPQSTALPTRTDAPGLPGIKVVMTDKIASMSPATGGSVQPSTVESYLLHRNQPHTVQQIILHQTNV